MTKNYLKLTLAGACAVTVIGISLAFAETSPTTGNPDTNASDRNFDTNQPNSVPGGMQKTKDAANRGLNHVDSGVHKMVHKSKRGAHKAHVKAERAEDKMTKPAIKPN